MFRLFVRDSFAAAHRLENYHGKCEYLHGHTFKVEVLVEGDQIKEGGMLLDFTILKGHLHSILEDLDHKYINEIPFFRERTSSSEYLALYIHSRLKDQIKENGVTVAEVRVWESDNTYAAYRG
jgi:6-pyruvoyltetrahydropterin/6-carboxytetrahydropterin synthase